MSNKLPGSAARKPVAAQDMGWDGGGDWTWGVVIPRQNHYYTGLARFRSAAAARRVADAMNALSKAVADRRTVPTTGVESAALAVLEAFYAAR